MPNAHTYQSLSAKDKEGKPLQVLQPAGEKTVAGAQLLGFGDSPIMRTGQSLVVLSSTDIGQEARDPMVGSSEPMLLLHGYPLDNRLWSSVMPILASQHYCIAPDFRGFGDSVEETKSFSIADLADDCALLLSKLGVQDKVVVCGLSMGGYVAMEFVERHPTNCSRAILTNTRCNADDIASATHRRSIANTALRDGVPKAVLPMLQKLLSQYTLANKPAVVELVKEMMMSTKASTIAWSQLAMAHRADFSLRMKSWDIPVVCIGGKDDTICPPSTVKQMAEVIPNVTTYMVDGSSHLTPLEAPELFATQCKS